jgi:hypothetical protein
MRPAADPYAGAPRKVLEELLRGRDVLDGVVLSAQGGLLAGEPGLAEPARRLLGAAPGSGDIEVATQAGIVFAARSATHAVAVVCRRVALPALVAYDLRVALASLSDGESDGDGGLRARAA